MLSSGRWATVPFGWQMFVVHKRLFKIDENPQYSLQWHWHSVMLARAGKVPVEVLAAQQDSFKKALSATGVMDHEGNINTADNY
eukprot:10856079-Prorocentrum_lima.AAC.1